MFILKISFLFNSPTDSVFNEIANSSTNIFSSLDLNTLFGLDPNNHALNVIFSALGLGICNLILIYFLCIMLLYLIIYNKYYNKLELPWLNKYFSEKTSTKIKNIISKLLKYSNKNNKIMIVYILIFLIISSFISTYLLYKIFINFDNFVQAYLNYKNLKSD